MLCRPKTRAVIRFHTFEPKADDKGVSFGNSIIFKYKHLFQVVGYPTLFDTA